jgi:hypothetical protein
MNFMKPNNQEESTPDSSQKDGNQEKKPLTELQKMAILSKVIREQREKRK